MSALCQRGSRGPLPAQAMEAEELQVEEADLGPAAPAAEPVADAPLPPDAGAIIANLDQPQPGNRRIHFDMPLANPRPAPPPQPMPVANVQAARCHFDLVPGNIPFGPHLLVEPDIPEEQDRMQGGTPATYKYLQTGSKRVKPLVVSSDGYSFSFVSISHFFLRTC